MDKEWRGVTADTAELKGEAMAYRTNYNKLDSLLNKIDWSDVYLQTDASHAFDVFMK